MEVEYRFNSAASVRMSGDGKMINGHAAVFNSPITLWPGVKEQVKPGAFAKTIKESDVRALFNHDPNWVLGRNKSGTLTMREDDQGLQVDIIPPDAQWATDLKKSIARGDISGMSFGFRVIKESWTNVDDDAGTMLRDLEEVQLYDVSPVTYPAYAQTDCTVRALAWTAGEGRNQKLFKALVKLQRAETLNEEELRLVRSYHDQMRDRLQATQPGMESHSAADKSEPGQDPHSNQIAMRKIELLEAELLTKGGA